MKETLNKEAGMERLVAFLGEICYNRAVNMEERREIDCTLEKPVNTKHTVTVLTEHVIKECFCQRRSKNHKPL